MIKYVLFAAVFSVVSRADTVYSLTATTPGSPSVCTETPAGGTCSSGDPAGYAANPETAYATVTATITAPGVLSLSASAFGDDVDGNGACCTGADAIATASFSYTLEVVGGVGQVLVVPGPGLGALSTCEEVSSIYGSQGCGAPQVYIGGVFGGAAYLATYGVPFSFTGSAAAFAQPDYDEAWYGMAEIDLPISDLVLLNPTTYQPASGTIIDPAAAVPEPEAGWMVGLGLATLFAATKRLTKA